MDKGTIIIVAVLVAVIVLLFAYCTLVTLRKGKTIQDMNCAGACKRMFPSGSLLGEMIDSISLSELSNKGKAKTAEEEKCEAIAFSKYLKSDINKALLDLLEK